jgi:hypothetical protein
MISFARFYEQLRALASSALAAGTTTHSRLDRPEVSPAAHDAGSAEINYLSLILDCELISCTLKLLLVTCLNLAVERLIRKYQCSGRS